MTTKSSMSYHFCVNSGTGCQLKRQHVANAKPKSRNDQKVHRIFANLFDKVSPVPALIIQIPQKPTKGNPNQRLPKGYELRQEMLCR